MMTPVMTPVQEVAIYLAKEAVQARIEKRKSQVLKSVKYTYTTPDKAVSTAKKQKNTPADVIVVEDSSDSEEEVGAAEAATAASAHATTTRGDRQLRAVKGEPPSCEQLAVPKTIRETWRRVERLWYDGQTDVPQCRCASCPYCSGGPLQNRQNLIERLVEVELEQGSLGVVRATI